MRQALAHSNRDLPTPTAQNDDYAPIVVTPEVSRHNPDRLVAFIGRQVCFFEKNGQQPEAGVPVEVMITRPLYRRSKDGFLQPDELIALVVRPITADDILIVHNGFRRSASHPASATAIVDDSFVRITPGRTEIWTAEHGGHDREGMPLIARRSGSAWINRTEIINGVARLEGLAQVADAAYADVVRR